MRQAARLKNEWPDLFDAIEEAVYTQPIVDVRAIAEQYQHPVQTITAKGDVTFDTSVGGIAPQVIEVYLDGAIRSWRRIADNADHKHFDIAPYYVDAFQSVRLSLLDETLPLDGEDDTE
jgi:hypothetical protein